MAREVNIFITNWQVTGSNVSVPQYTMTARIDWVDDTGAAHSQTRAVLFPNVLTQLPTDYVATAMKQMLIDYARKLLGVDP